MHPEENWEAVIQGGIPGVHHFCCLSHLQARAAARSEVGEAGWGGHTSYLWESWFFKRLRSTAWATNPKGNHICCKGDLMEGLLMFETRHNQCSRLSQLMSLVLPKQIFNKYRLYKKPGMNNKNKNRNKHLRVVQRFFKGKKACEFYWGHAREMFWLCLKHLGCFPLLLLAMTNESIISVVKKKIDLVMGLS